MDSPWLGELLSTSLLEFTSSPNTNNLNNLKHPNELVVMFLETLSDTIVDSADTNEHLNTTSVASASDVSCPDTCYSHTSSASVFAVTTENDLRLPIFIIIWL